MSRRCHHGSPRHARQLAREQLAREQRRGSIVADRPIADDRPTSDDRAAADDVGVRDEPPATEANGSIENIRRDERVERDAPAVDPPPAMAQVAPLEPRPHPAPRVEHRPAWTPAASRPPALGHVPATPQQPRHAEPEASGADGIERGATAPQLRRFIKSRAYVPMHELRRRFAINGGEDDVTPVDVARQRIYVGLPAREGGLLGELLRAGDIGYELSLDPIAPIVVGVYPMRPVPRS
jgi:hypothetical protein